MPVSCLNFVCSISFQMPRPSSKYIAILLFAGLVTGVAFAQESRRGPGRKAVNLKVLPANISHDSLMTVMHEWENALGVDCAFCHGASTPGDRRMDFASDDNRHKGIARHMFTMTDSINHHYFGWWNAAKEGRSAAVSCYTCHHGHAEPEAWTPGGGDEKK